MSLLGGRPPLDHDEIRREFRKEREKMHYMHMERRNCSGRLELPGALPLPQITLDHCQDSCNKLVPIYWTGQKTGNITPIVRFLYKQWFRGHSTDLEFGRFIAKVICIKQSKSVELAVQDILEIHKAWCEKVDAAMPIFQEPDIMTIDRIDEVGRFGINGTQHFYFKLQPLFRSLILIIGHAIGNAEEQLVHLVSTGHTSRLSQPINFAEFEGERSGSEAEENYIVTTTLPKAIDFILKLEERENKAFPETRDLSVLDNRLGGIETLKREAKKFFGYTGEEIRGPATSWVLDVEGEAISLPKIAVKLPVMRW